MTYAKAVVVYDSTGKSIPGCIAMLNGLASEPTNQDGYALFGVNYDPGPASLIVFANGYKNYVQEVNLRAMNENLCIGGHSTDPQNQNLPPLPSSFNKPSRDQIVNVMANFCNLRDADDIPIFTIFITSLMMNGQMDKANDWVNRLKAAGSTHLDIGLTAQYNENLGWPNTPGHIYPIPTIDLTDNLSDVAKILDHIMFEWNMIPHLHLPWDDNGFEWGVQHVPSIISQLSDYTDEILWNTGWDGCFPSWSRDQTIQAINIMRACLGNRGQIATEFAGPSGSNLPYIDMGRGQEDYDGPLQELDVLLLEYGTGQFDNKCGMQQQMTRLFSVQKYPYPLIPGCDDNTNVYYLSAPRHRGPLGINAYEWVKGGAYNQIRKYDIPETAVSIANGFKAYGFSQFGNGQPST